MSQTGKLFSGRTALVTGGGSGIGKCVSHVLASEGALVIVADINVEAARSTADSLPGGLQHLGIEVDVGCSESVKSLFEAVLNTFSCTPCIVVHCAGIALPGMGIINTKEDDFDRVIRINLKVHVNGLFTHTLHRYLSACAPNLTEDFAEMAQYNRGFGSARKYPNVFQINPQSFAGTCLIASGTFVVNKEAARTMIAQKVRDGTIVNFASISAKTIDGRTGPYASSKAGVVALSKVAAKEHASHGIRVNTVLPSLVDTPMPAAVCSPDCIAMFTATIPLGRACRPEEVAEVVKFLCGPKSSYVAGAAVDVAGGTS